MTPKWPNILKGIWFPGNFWVKIFWQLLFKVLDLAQTCGEFYSRCLSWPTEHFTAITQLVEFASRPPQHFSLKLTSEFAPERSFVTVRQVTNPKSTTNSDEFFFPQWSPFVDFNFRRIWKVQTKCKTHFFRGIGSLPRPLKAGNHRAELRVEVGEKCPDSWYTAIFPMNPSEFHTVFYGRNPVNSPVGSLSHFF